MNTKRPRGSLNLMSLLKKYIPAPTRRMEARFWAKVAISDEASCWPWSAGKTGNGYGTFKMTELHYCTVAAHRVAHFCASGSWPNDGQVVRHSCDNPICCNPRHLELGSQGDNIQDQWDRNRRRTLPAPNTGLGDGK